MTFSMKLLRLKTLSNACAMSQLSQYLAMPIHDTGLAGKACEFPPICLCWMSIHVNLTSNPLLAETFEMPELKFISEKVSHNPVIIAYHAEGEGWELNATSSGRTKFWGAWRTEQALDQ
jgi:Oxysterol-binding protein